MIHVTPPADDVPTLLRDLVQWMNYPHNGHPVIATAIAPFQFENIHPFRDGNGRTSRLLSMLYLHQAGFDVKRLSAISEYDDRDRAAIYDATRFLRRMQLDMTRQIESFAHVLATQLAAVRHPGEHSMRQNQLAPLRPDRAAGDADWRRPGPGSADSHRRLAPRTGNSGSHPTVGSPRAHREGRAAASVMIEPPGMRAGTWRSLSLRPNLRHRRVPRTNGRVVYASVGCAGGRWIRAAGPRAGRNLST